MKTSKTVYIFNMSEGVWPFITGISDPKERQFEIDEESHQGDRELFTNISEKSFVYINPEPVNDYFLSYFKKLSNIQDIEILIPETIHNRICDDIIEDKKVFKRLVEIGKNFNLVIKSYCSSYNLYNLINELKKHNVSVSTPESPDEENAWTVNYFGSKAGIRQLIDKMNKPGIQMAEGTICSGIDDAAEIATHWYLHHKGVVIKTHKAHSGAGVLLFKYGSLPKKYHECKIKIKEILNKNNYWKIFPIIVEKFIDVDSSVSGGFPNVEYQIKPNGRVETLYPCAMRINDKAVFVGVEINNSIYSKALTNKLNKIGLAIGKEYSKVGYRGNYEIDYALTKEGKVFITETNVRKTGGTFVYETAKKLIGKNFLNESYILSADILKLPENKKHSFKSVFEKISSILYSPETKEGIVITSANIILQRCLGYIVFGKNKKRALEIEKKMISLLNSHT